jgi:hypothetical protein
MKWTVRVIFAGFIAARPFTAHGAEPTQPTKVDAPNAVAPLRLSMDAPPGCPGRSAFFAAMHDRTQRIREARDNEPARFFRVEIVLTGGGGATGTMTVRDLDGQEGRRELRGEDCESVATGLALVAALIVDPSAVLAPPDAPSQSPPQTPAPSPRSDPSARLSAGAALELLAGVNPNPAVIPRLFVDLELPGILKRLNARASVGRALTQSVVTSLGTATFALTLLRFEPCFDLVAKADVFHLNACGVVEGSFMSASGTNTYNGQDVGRSWAELGLAIRPTWVLSNRIELGLLGGLTAPTARPRFYFAPDTLAYQVATWAGFGEVTVGAYFW